MKKGICRINDGKMAEGVCGVCCIIAHCKYILTFYVAMIYPYYK